MVNSGWFDSPEGAIAFLILFVMGVLWCCVPFAVFGIKPLLQRLIQTNQENAEAIRKLTAEVWEIRSQGARRELLTK